MAIWPTNNAMPTRVGSGAFATSLDPLDWSYPLPGDPFFIGTPTITLYDFLSDAQGWGGGFAWNSLDGEPAPGDMKAEVAPGSVGSQSRFMRVGVAPTMTWEDLGVPPGSVVTGIRVRFNARIYDRVHNNAQTLSQTFSWNSGLGENTLLSSDMRSTAVDESWHAYDSGVPTSAFNVPSGSSASNTAVEFQYLITDNSLGGAGSSYTSEVDEIEITVYYDGNLDERKQFLAGPVVSDGGYVWGVAFESNGSGDKYLVCVDATGAEQSVTALPANSKSAIATDASDQAYIVSSDRVTAYDTSGALLWTRTGSFDVAFNTAIVGGDGFLYVGNKDSGTTFIEALDITDGTVDHDFDTGYTSSADEGFSKSGTSLYLPLFDSGVPHVVKVSTSGVVAWDIDLTTVDDGYDNYCTVPVVFGSQVLFTASYNQISGFTACLSLADTDGAFQWKYENVNVADVQLYQGISVVGTTVLVPMYDNDGNNSHLAAVALADGLELWVYQDAAEGGFLTENASAGNDGTLLLPRTKMVRLNLADGSVGSKLTITSPLPPSLSSTHTYIMDGSLAGSLYAYTSGEEPPTPPSTECTDAPPQMWLFSSTRKIGRHQEVSRDFLVDADSTTGEAIPDWVYSTGFAVTPEQAVVTGLVVDASAPVSVRVAKAVTVSGPALVRDFEAVSATGQDEVWIAGAGDFRSQQLRVEFAGANGAELRRAMWSREIVGGVGG